MSSSYPSVSRHPEFGGITILVALLMLVLLTISAFAMSKNSLREVIVTGTSRQAADVRNIADSGLDWSMYWMAPDRTNMRPSPAAGSAAEALRSLKTVIGTDLNGTLAGLPQPLVHTGGELNVSGSTDPARSYALRLTAMGDILPLGTGATLPDLNPNPVNKLKLWSVRSDAQVAYSGGLVFQHSREAWFTLLPE
jgi:hypothetical protein